MGRGLVRNFHTRCLYRKSHSLTARSFDFWYIMMITNITNSCENPLRAPAHEVIGNLSKDVFERRTSTGSEAFSLFIRLDANKFVVIIFFSLIKTIYPRIWTKPLPIDGKSQLPVDVRPSKTLLLKLPNLYICARACVNIDFVHSCSIGLI